MAERGPLFADGSTLRGLVPTLVVALAAVVAVVVAGVALLTRETEDPSTVAAPASASLGPAADDDLAGYVAASQSRLGEVEGATYAVVSFDRYLTEDDARDLLGAAGEGVAPAIDRWLVAGVGSAPEVARTVAGWLEDDPARRAEAEGQIVEITSLLPTVLDPEFVAFYESELDRYRTLLDAPRADDAVFGAVVLASASDLRALAVVEGIRLVDPAGSARLAVEATVRGVRPEEIERAGNPAWRPGG